ncbi:MFS transporter [Micromonospora sp. NPDC051296]|uniref:MFS transporter n=1 Tax=Micromonospora sp. NPDC051296 TaxID=3155046 RepID=UPI003430424F
MTTPATTALAERPGPPAAPRLRTRWLILAVLCLAQLVVVLDNTVLTVAVPALSRDLAASTADTQWIINAYALVLSGLLLTAGSAVDRYGRRRMLMVGLVLFGAASLAAAAASSPGQLVAARAALGVGGALLVTATLAVAIQVFDADERPRAIGIWAAAHALGYAAGPPVGGLVLGYADWPAIFLLNVPVVVICLVAAGLLVPESRRPGAGRLDFPGAVLSGAGLTAVVYAVVSAPDHGWTAPAVLGAASAGAVLLGLFVGWERRIAHPMLDLHFFRDQRFVGAVAGVVLITFGSAGSLFLLAQQLQFVRGHSAWEAGLRMAPFALTVVLLNLAGLAARLIRLLGTPVAIAVGMAQLAAGLVVAAYAPTDGYAVLLLGLVLMGAGCALANPAIVDAVMSAIPPEKAGAGAGVDGTMAEVGASLGVAALGAVMSARFVAALPADLAGADSFAAAYAAAAESQRTGVADAFGAAVATSQTVGAVAVLAGGCLAAFLLHRAARRTA